MDISGKLSQANGRLKAGQVKVSIVNKNNWLYLRGTFPPKPLSKKQSPYQQWLALNLPATPLGLKEAERQAREIGLKLMTGNFEWETRQRIERVGDLIEQFGRSLLAQGLSKTSWKKEYQSPLLKIADEPLDADRLRSVLLERTEPDTRTRRRWALAIAHFAAFFGCIGAFIAAIYGDDYIPISFVATWFPISYFCQYHLIWVEGLEKEVKELREKVSGFDQEKAAINAKIDRIKAQFENNQRFGR